MLLLKHIFDDSINKKIGEIFELLRELSDRKLAIEWLEVFLRYVASAAEKMSNEDMREAVERSVEGGENLMPTLAEKWIEEGIQKGIKKGKIEGRREGILKAIKVGLKLRFKEEGLFIYPEVEKIKELELLEKILDAIESEKDLNEIKSLLPQQTQLN